MRLEVNVTQLLFAEVRVNLGSGDIRVAEHLLDTAKIGPSRQQVSGETVPERMRGDRFF